MHLISRNLGFLRNIKLNKNYCFSFKKTKHRGRCLIVKRLKGVFVECGLCEAHVEGSLSSNFVMGLCHLYMMFSCSHCKVACNI